jgi:predicted nucleic-acid-binding Zn-ribbon protein
MNIKAPEFDFDVNSSQLLCPKCGGNNLHHDTVHVFWREGDNAESGTHVESDDYLTLVDKNIEANPSLRRDGLFVNMSCEVCGPLSLSLAIFQHKGTTFLSWVDPLQPAGW